MKIKKVERKVNRFGVRKYAQVPSGTVPFVYYTVGKVRTSEKNYKYVCSCPDFFFRQKPCKHIKQFKLQEHKMK
jgi:predicted nucleic acid-binding Zn finger protein